ncbi:AAA family ATPase [Methanoregula sp.]|uniref:AAA family ATPase n=1 Tax=Methanoregula sp. TaxID=2052170 RepID=UPI0035634FC1
MRLSQITIEKLFYKYNFAISLRNEDRITIIHGPNGSGKTTVLEILNNFFKLNFRDLSKIPFAKISLSFDNFQVIHLYKNCLFAAGLDDCKNLQKLCYYKRILNDERFVIVIESPDNLEDISSEYFFISRSGSEKILVNTGVEHSEKYLDFISFEDLEKLQQEILLRLKDMEYLQDLDEKSKLYYSNFIIRKFLEEDTDSQNIHDHYEKELFRLRNMHVNLENEMRVNQNITPDTRNRFLHDIKIVRMKIEETEEKIRRQSLRERQRLIVKNNRNLSDYQNTLENYLLKLSKNIRPLLIGSQRLQVFSSSRMKMGNDTIIKGVNICADELKSQMNAAEKAYNEASQERDQTFMNILMEGILSNNREVSKTIREDFEHLRKTQEHLAEFGLYKLEKDITSHYSINDIDTKPDARIALDLYIKHTSEKLDLYNSLDNKMKKFQQIISDLFTEKKICFSRDKGFWFIDTQTNIEISPSNLSSGEQHIVILFFKFLFEVPDSALVLIDEPEISLHVGWQRKFVEILSDIVKINAMDIMISTHAPAIIADRDDLMVKVGGKV